MKRFVLVAISLAALAILVLSYLDYRTYTLRKELHSESLRVQELIGKCEAILNEADVIRAKVEILKQKGIEDKEFKAFIEKSEVLLKKAGGVQAKCLERKDELYQIYKRYEGLPSQKILFKNRFSEPKVLP